MEWERSKSVPYPSIWRKFEGKKVVNGATRKYWIQDITEEFFEPVVTLMCTKFLRDEVLSMSCGIADDEVSVKEMDVLWREILKQKLGLICLTKDENTVKIAGINCTGRSHKNDKPINCEGKSLKFKKICETINYLSKQKDCFEEFGIDAYLTALGLYVPPLYRGEGIGLELLNARRDLCNAVGIKASLTVFTSIVSQKVAMKAGFKDFVVCSYEELEKIDPLYSFPGIPSTTKYIKYMVILY